ncbi:MAG: radical SAM family heme chaperone HemW [Puniceicoccales bacterium]|jgi:oxygen-independent coproporphyrinogen-3 oxidase|nr:radical SAM family heme chaperone HemW [Puniceicoccales bacterium]
MQGKDLQEEKFLGIYVHVPFCAHKCAFCGFFQQPPRRQTLDMYVETLAGDMRLQQIDRQVNTIYFGGGTPSILPTEHIYKIGETLPINSSLQEWSVECSPTGVTAEKMKAFRDIGVTRLTLGIQSFDQKILQTIGRRQTLKQVFTAYDTMCSCGFENIGIDLIFAIPGQSLESWETDLKIALSLSPKHISTYNLTFEGNSELNKQMCAGKISPLCSDVEAEFFIRTGEILAQHGYDRYEVSNFSKPGFESIHNVHTWEMCEWVGYGPSASSQFNDERFTNVPSLQLWREGILNGRHKRCDFQKLSEEILIQDSLIFGLRMTRGVDLQKLSGRFKSFSKAKYETLFNLLIDNKLATCDGNNLSLTLDGLLVADTISVEILSVESSTFPRKAASGSLILPPRRPV